MRDAIGRALGLVPGSAARRLSPGVLALALLVGGSCRDAQESAPAAEPSPARVEPSEPPPGEPHPGLRQALARAAARCEVDRTRCAVRGCVDELDVVQREIERDPRSFELLSSLTRGDSREAVIALSFANGLLARWQRDGTLTDVIRGPQARELVDHALGNVCNGPLLSPLTLPGQPLGDPWPWQESEGGSAGTADVQGD